MWETQRNEWEKETKLTATHSTLGASAKPLLTGLLE